MERMSTEAQLRPLLTAREVAERLHLSPSTVRRRIADGEIPAVRLGVGPQSPVRIDADDLERWLFAPPPQPAARGATSPIAGSHRRGLEGEAA
jgi:excisionase family DNA binding protein